MFTVCNARLTTLDTERIANLRRAILSLKNDHERGAYAPDW